MSGWVASSTWAPLSRVRDQHLAAEDGSLVASLGSCFLLHLESLEERAHLAEGGWEHRRVRRNRSSVALLPGLDCPMRAGPAAISGPARCEAGTAVPGSLVERPEHGARESDERSEVGRRDANCAEDAHVWQITRRAELVDAGPGHAKQRSHFANGQKSLQHRCSKS